MKIKCWQGECPEGKECCCWECDRRKECKSSCDETECEQRRGTDMTKKIERLGDFVTILTAIIWAIGLWELYNDACGYPMIIAMMVSISMWLKVIVPEGGEDDDF